MDVTSEPTSNNQTDQYPLLMERMESHNEHDRIIDITRSSDTSLRSFPDDQSLQMDVHRHEDRPSRSTQGSGYQHPSSSDGLNSGNAMFTRSTDGYVHRHRSPLNSGLWISVELLITLGQIIASVIVLSISRNENPQAPLFAWVVGYASGCVATLPILYWRFRNRNQRSRQDSVQSSQGSSQASISESTPYTAISVNQALDEDNVQSAESASRGSQIPGSLSARLNRLMDNFKMALDCFFAVWFVVGNVWIFGGQSSAVDAPKLYKLCIVLLTFSCIGYAMPFILCATICCCLPCIISILGFREDFSQTRGATTEYINTLPTYKFKLNNSGNPSDQDNSGASGGGVLAAGTEKERAISEEDAVCCICLNKYVDDEELRELPCFHVFHVECVDKWLKINACCPLCKSELCESSDPVIGRRVQPTIEQT